MSDLIDQLKSEHQEISLILAEVNRLGINTDEGQLKLISAKKLLFKHLLKENEELFPILSMEAKNHKLLRTNMQVLSVEMKGVLEKTVKFFQTHGRGSAQVDYSLDFGKVFPMLVHHFTKEEKVLFTEYERIKNTAKNMLFK